MASWGVAKTGVAPNAECRADAPREHPRYSVGRGWPAPQQGRTLCVASPTQCRAVSIPGPALKC